MKKLIVSIFMCMGLLTSAQTFSAAMEKAVAACVGLSESIGSTSTAGLKAANMALKKADIVYFGDLWLEKGKDLSVDGHFIFDEEFVDSLAENRLIIKFSSRYMRKRASWGPGGTGGRIKMTTLALEAGASAVWKSVNRKLAEYALVAEPGGLFTMTIRDEKGRALYSETVNNKQGAKVRKAQIKLPDKITKLYIEIKNTGRNDASFALLSN